MCVFGWRYIFDFFRYLYATPYLIPSPRSIPCNYDHSNDSHNLGTFCTRSHKLGIRVASWYQNVTNWKACNVCNESMVEDECHLLFTCSAYSAIRSRYVDIVRGSIDLSALLKTPPRRLSSLIPKGLEVLQYC